MKRIRRIDPAHRALIRSMPCIACELAGIQQTTPTEGHHIREREDGQQYGGSQKAHDDEMIPLCHEHHWNGVGSIYTHRGFLAEFGSERGLLEIIRKRIAGTEAA